ncbi:hypothetical protein MLPF_1003 [Mycobacterium lepromatosis]|nr:hypothetical protein MLPF_1003 [Mycobacterium lepromatosis]
MVRILHMRAIGNHGTIGKCNTACGTAFESRLFVRYKVTFFHDILLYNVHCYVTGLMSISL